MSWPGYKEEHWTYQSLERNYSAPLRAESVDWRLSEYVASMENETDESPLHLFDHAFTERQTAIWSLALPPARIGRDHFEVTDPTYR